MPSLWDPAAWAAHAAGPPPDEPAQWIAVRCPDAGPEDRSRLAALLQADAGPDDVVVVWDGGLWGLWRRAPLAADALAARARACAQWSHAFGLPPLTAAAHTFPAGTPWAEQAAALAALAAAPTAPKRRTRGPRVDWSARAAAVKARVDLAALIGARVPLRREGRCWVGRCPFHADTHPSFYVYPQGDAHYHCYGCGAHGDAVTWVRATESVGFAEAVARLEQWHGAPPDPAPVRATDAWGHRLPEPAWAAVYADLWPLLTLTDAHRAALRARGLSDAAIDAHGFRSMPVERQGWEVRLARPGEATRDLTGVPGFSQRDGGRLHGPSGILIPVRHPDGTLVGAQIRTDADRGGDRYRWWSTPPAATDADGAPRYPGGGALGALATCATYRAEPWDPADAEPEVWVTEGILKAIVAAEHLAVPVIGLPGLQRPGHALHLLRWLQPGRLVLALDADTAGEAAVPLLAAHLAQQFDALWSRGDLVVARWEGAKGLDDALVAGVPWTCVPVGDLWPHLRPPAA